MGKQRDNNVNAMRFQEQIASQKRIEELLSKIRRLERRIQFYDKGFSVWDCLRSTGKKSSIENKHWNRGGYNFDKWLEDGRECTLRSILVVEVPSLEQVKSEVKQVNFVPIDYVCLNCQEFGHITFLCPKEKLFTLVEANEDKFVDKKIPKFDDRELVNNKENVLCCEDKGVILKEYKLKKDVIFLSCSMNGEGCDKMPLIDKIEHEMPLDIFINMKELANWVH